ncbi:MAG: hypothetical protein VB140_01340 [Burkholderia sp.]
MLHKSSVRTSIDGMIPGDTNGLRTSEVRNPFVSPELCPSDAMASSRSIYATTPHLSILLRSPG